MKLQLFNIGCVIIFVGNEDDVMKLQLFNIGCVIIFVGNEDDFIKLLLSIWFFV